MQHNIKEGDKVTCIKGGILGYEENKSYEVTSIRGRKIGVKNNYVINYFYTEVNDNECFACFWDYFNFLKEQRKRNLRN